MVGLPEEGNPLRCFERAANEQDVRRGRSGQPAIHATGFRLQLNLQFFDFSVQAGEAEL